MAIALNIKLPSTDAISNINFLFLRNKHIVPFLCGITFLFGCLLHYQRGYFGQSVNYFHATGSDDAYISFRYGWNLIHYDTFSWNESGFRQTEGFTNPIWVLLSAAWALADNKDVIYPAMSITSAILTGIVLVSLAENVRENNTKNFSLAGILLLSLSPILWSHTTSGLESGLFGALIGLTAYISIFPQPKDRKALGFLVLASTLLRSDGFIYMFILLGALGVAKLSTWKRVGLGSLSGLAALLLWRTITFGSVVPNTAVAKLSFPWTQRIAPGMQFLLIALPGFLPLLLLGLFALRYIPRKQQFALGLVLAGWIAYYVYIGGDIYHERHLIGIMFLLACMASYQFDSMKVDGKQAIAYLVLFTAFMFLPMMIGDSRFEYWKQKPEDPWILFGKEIGKDRQRYGVIVTGAAGKIPFFCRWRLCR